MLQVGGAPDPGQGADGARGGGASGQELPGEEQVDSLDRWLNISLCLLN